MPRSSAARPSSAIARSGQTSLFGLFAAAEPAPGGAPAAQQGEIYPEIEAWSPKQLLAFEKEALGFYVSGHPLDRYRGDLTRYATRDDERLRGRRARRRASTRSAASSASTAR